MTSCSSKVSTQTAVVIDDKQISESIKSADALFLKRDKASNLSEAFTTLARVRNP